MKVRKTVATSRGIDESRTLTRGALDAANGGAQPYVPYAPTRTPYGVLSDMNWSNFSFTNAFSQMANGMFKGRPATPPELMPRDTRYDEMWSYMKSGAQSVYNYFGGGRASESAPARANVPYEPQLTSARYDDGDVAVYDRQSGAIYGSLAAPQGMLMSDQRAAPEFSSMIGDDGDVSIMDQNGNIHGSIAAPEGMLMSDQRAAPEFSSMIGDDGDVSIMDQNGNIHGSIAAPEGMLASDWSPSGEATSDNTFVPSADDLSSFEQGEQQRDTSENYEPPVDYSTNMEE